VKSRLDLAVSDLGTAQLKNIAEPVRVYSSKSARRCKQNRQSPPPLSIVVLPFTNLSGDPNQDYCADGITDNLTTD
jgi:adenylate cyclase